MCVLYNVCADTYCLLTEFTALPNTAGFVTECSGKRESAFDRQSVWKTDASCQMVQLYNSGVLITRSNLT